MLLNTVKRLLHEEDGMEMIEWAIVGIVFAVAAAGSWTVLHGKVDGALVNVANELVPVP